MIKVQRALISVSDKTGVLELARKLKDFGVEILSTGGTAALLRNNGVDVIEVSDYTGFPEILDGRVKTLHPSIHGGLLAVREKPEHMKQLKEHNMKTIDMAVVNLYPFEKVIKKKSVSLAEAIENIDIGGPTMIRAAAKNYKNVAVICDPGHYREVMKELENNSGILSDSVLFKLAVDAFLHCSRYDGIIYDFLNKRNKGKEDFSKTPQEFSLNFSKIQDLRYGENPHQSAAFYRDNSAVFGLAAMKQLHGKELSFNNILDLNAALSFVREFDQPAAVVIKHNNPTGIAENDTLAKAYKQAWSTDKLSAFGGIIGLNRPVDLETAKGIAESGFMECIIAPQFQKQAFALLSKKRNIRLIEIDFKKISGERFDFKKVSGGMLVQDPDTKAISPKDFKVVSKKKPTKMQIESMLFGWKAIRSVKSNAIILVKERRTVGMGCGQTSRVDSARIAISKAGKGARNSVLISDAFLPMPDTVTIAAKAGIKAIIQTGGSIQDEKVIKEADKQKIVMVMTGARHFKH